MRTHRLSVAAAGILTVAAAWLWAHEGHAPLPTRGVDTSLLGQGKLIVSHDARALLDVATEPVVARRDLADRLLATVTLEAPWNHHAYASTRLGGRIVALHAKPGDPVAAGDPLADVQSLDLDDLQLELLNAHAAIQLSEKIVESLKPLVKDQAVPEREVREATAKHQQNVTALAVHRARWLGLGLTQMQLGDLLAKGQSAMVRSLTITSPIGGVVSHADVAIGRVVEPTEHVFEILDLSKVWVRIGVLEQDWHRVEVGQTVEIALTAYAGRPPSVDTIRVKGLYLDPQTHLGVVWAELTNPVGAEPLYRPGMVGQAHILLTASKKSLAVPASAVLADGAEKFVLVENSATGKASEYQKRPVAVGIEADGFVQIQGGELYPGNRVVTTGSHQLASFFVQGNFKVSPEAARNIDLLVQPIGEHSVEDVLELDGVVELPPTHRGQASALLGGKITAIGVQRNQHVKKGDLLATVASWELQQVQLELIRAHLQMNFLDETLKRLQKTGAATQRTLWDTESSLNETRNKRDSLIRKLETAGVAARDIEEILAKKAVGGDLPVRSPIDGVVVHFDKVLGQVIKAEEPLFEVHDLAKAWIQVYVTERDLPQVKLGQTARVRLVGYPKFLGNGIEQRSGQALGSANRTLSMWIELAEPQGLPVQHNLLARATVTLAKGPPVLAVPIGAVLREGTRAYVFVEKEPLVFERRLVHLGRADDRWVEVVHGVRLGEKIAVRGAAPLQTAYAGIR